MKYIVLCIVMCFSFGLKAQKIYDKNAEELLSRISSEIKKHEQVLADFSFSVDFPGAEEDVKKGELIQNGSSYFVSIGETQLLNAAEGFYLIDKSSNTVQINDPLDNSATDIYNPISLMEKYDSGEFEYAIVGEEKVEGKRCTLVEFKPSDRYSELSKIRVAIDVNEELPVYIKVFNKDASRINIDVKDMTLNMKSTGELKFQKDSYSGYSIEDLRID